MSKLVMRSICLLCAAASSAAHAAPDGVAAPVAAANSAQPTKYDPAVSAKALELAQLLNPTEAMINLAGQSFDQAFDKSVADGGSVETLEKDYPGMVAELRRVAREATLADLRADMPTLQRRYAIFFAEVFSPEEMAELVAFYRSPTGGKIIKAKFANVDVSTLVDRFAADPNAKFSTDDVKAINDGAVSAMWGGLSADDFRALMAFGLRPVARKLSAAVPRMNQIEAEIANEPDPELDAAIDAASRKVYERYGIEGGAGDR